jgi:hypothetical protein
MISPLDLLRGEESVARSNDVLRRVPQLNRPPRSADTRSTTKLYSTIIPGCVPS